MVKSKLTWIKESKIKLSRVDQNLTDTNFPNSISTVVFMLKTKSLIFFFGKILSEFFNLKMKKMREQIKTFLHTQIKYLKITCKQTYQQTYTHKNMTCINIEHNIAQMSFLIYIEIGLGLSSTVCLVNIWFIFHISSCGLTCLQVVFLFLILSDFCKIILWNFLHVNWCWTVFCFFILQVLVSYLFVLFFN